MRVNSTVLLTGIQSAKGEFKTQSGTDTVYDSCTFHLAVDMGEKSNGESMGVVTRPFKFGTSAEFAKWKPLKDKWPTGGVKVDATFDMVAGKDDSTKMTLVDIQLHKG